MKITNKLAALLIAFPIISFAGNSGPTLGSAPKMIKAPSTQGLLVPLEKSKLTSEKALKSNFDFSNMPMLRKSLGTNSGGGGTSIKSTKSNALILWDLFANNPLYSESEIGDQIQNPTHYEIERVPYSNFKSFEILKIKLSLIEIQYPLLFKIITGDGFLESDKTLALFSTAKYVKNLEELFFKYDYSPDDYVALPLAHFDEMTSFIYLNVDLWNQMGLESQAGFLLHERLRQLQLKHVELSNELIQGIVSFVINPEFAMLMGVEPSDDFFKFNQTTKPTVSSMDNALERYKKLVRLGFFSTSKVLVKNPKTVGKRNSTTTESASVLIDAKTCPKLISGFESVINTFRSKLSCSEKGTLQGTGELYFTSPMTSNKIIIEVVASLYSPNDGGSEIEVDLFKSETLPEGIKTIIANRSHVYVRSSLNSVTYPPLGNIYSIDLMANYNTYRFVIDRDARTYSVYMITASRSLLLASASINAEVNLTDSKMSWSFSINNNSSVQTIQITK